jgi:hypothetical protein
MRAVERVLAWDERAFQRITAVPFPRPFLRSLSFPLLVATYVGYGYMSGPPLPSPFIIFGTPAGPAKRSHRPWGYDL